MVFTGKSKSSNVPIKTDRFFYKNCQKPLNFPILIVENFSCDFTIFKENQRFLHKNLTVLQENLKRQMFM